MVNESREMPSVKEGYMQVSLPQAGGEGKAGIKLLWVKEVQGLSVRPCSLKESGDKAQSD